MKLFDVVRATAASKCGFIKAGTEGAIVHELQKPGWFLVEFPTANEDEPDIVAMHENHLERTNA